MFDDEIFNDLHELSFLSLLVEHILDMSIVLREIVAAKLATLYLVGNAEL